MFASYNTTSVQRGRWQPWSGPGQAIAWLAAVAWLTMAAALPPRAHGQTPSAGSTIKAYPLPAAELQTVAAELKRSLTGRGVRISVDTRTSQLLVVGPAEIHQSIAEQLKAGTLGKPAEAADPNLHTLRNISWKEFEGQLKRVGFVAESAAGNVDPARYLIRTPAGGEAHVAVARAEGKVKVAATTQLVPAMRKLAETLDRPAARPGEASQLVTLDRADPNTVLQLLNYLQSAARPLNPASGKHQHIGEYVSLLFQPGAQPQPAPPPPPPLAQPGQPGAVPPEGAPPVEGAEGAQPGVPADPEAFGSIGNVVIEYIEGLDTLILKGRKADVEKVMRLIEQIEQQSQSTRPEVEIFHLRYVDGRALNDLLTQIYDQVFTARQGRVTITSLIKPNALLLIGRKENLPAVKELIEKLDRPIAGDTELKIFPLKRIIATDAEAKLEALFTPTPQTGTGAVTGQGTGLSTRVNIISDERTNSLIVQASPRDLVEVARLLETLDGAVSEKKGHIRIIKLRNSLADELVPVIQEALQGEGGGGGAGNQPTQGPGAITGPAPGAGANAGSAAQGRSLQLLQVGGRTLESGILSDMQITSDPRGNSIIVTGPPENMDLIEALIRQLDELPATEAQIKVFTIVNGDAAQLADLLRQLFGQSTGTQAGNQGLQALLQTATGGGDSALVPLRFSVDVRTNSIVASGSTGDLNVVYKVLVRLDEGNIRERITTVYRLRNAPALEVANSLTQLRQQQQQLQQIAPTLTSAPQTLEKEVIVVPEQVSNSLIVSATPRVFDEIRRVVEELDRRPNMVIIQVLLAEVSLNDFNEFGIEMGLQDSLLFDRGIAGVGAPRVGFPFNQANLGNDNTPASLATRENVAPQVLSNLGVGRTNAAAGFGGLVLSAGNESVNVLVRALQQSQRMQILSRPQVQTLDNQPAYVQVGQQVPYITSSNQTQFGIQNQTTFQDVGVILGVTPRTSPDGMIVMEIDAVKSDLGPEAEGIAISVSADGTVIRQPIINVTRAQTTVSARSGQTVILGGLITRDQTETTRRVPYLGDIPVLGRLFRFDAVDIQRTELLIIMTPYVMRTDEHVAWLNMRESERLHWCLADVANIHGQAQNFTSSADPGLQTPLIYPAEMPPPAGLIAPENLTPGLPPNAWPNVPPTVPGSQNLPFPGDPNYNPTPLPRMQPGNLPIPPQNYQPIPTSAPSNFVPNPPATPDQSNRTTPANQLRAGSAKPVGNTAQPAIQQPQPNQATSVPGSLLRPMGPLQALPPVPQGPPQFTPPYQAQPQQVQYGPQPQPGTPGNEPRVRPANYQQQPPHVAPAVYMPPGTNPQYTPVAR